MICAKADDSAMASLDRYLTARLGEIGVTRLANTTGLDRVGIPTWAAVKPGTRDVISVYSGKGLTDEAARIGAILECVERTSALSPAGDGRGWLTRCVRQLAEVWPASAFTEKTTSPDGHRGWVPATDLRTGSIIGVPQDRVFLNRPDPASRGVWTSNGLAAGVSRASCITHALLELVERDAVSLADVAGSAYDAAFLESLSQQLGLDTKAIMEKYSDRPVAQTIEECTLPGELADLVNRFTSAGLSVTIKLILSVPGTYVFGAAVLEQTDYDEYLGAAGYCADICPKRALRGALLELAQSRATDLQGAREDCGGPAKRRIRSLPRYHWMATRDRTAVPFPHCAGACFSSAVKQLLQSLAAAGLARAAVVDLPDPVGLHCVRVLVPGIETWHATAGQSHLGHRARLGLPKTSSHLEI